MSVWRTLRYAAAPATAGKVAVLGKDCTSPTASSPDAAATGTRDPGTSAVSGRVWAKSTTVRPTVGSCPVFRSVIVPVTVSVPGPASAAQATATVLLSSMSAPGGPCTGQRSPADGISATTCPNCATRSVFVAPGTVAVVTVSRPSAGTTSVPVCAGSSTTV